jgi:hypothetical protein
MKRLLTKILFIIFGGGMAMAAPVIPDTINCNVSYSTALFATADGDLALNEYALAEDGQWYVRTVPKTIGQFVATTSPEAIKDKTEVSIIPGELAYYTHCAYDDKVVRKAIGSKTYLDLGRVKNAPIPKETNWRSIVEAPAVEAAIALDATNNTLNTISVVTSMSWTHTVSGTDRVLWAGIMMDDSADVDRTVTALTFNSDVMTRFGTDGNDDTTNVTIEQWNRTAPDVGSSLTIQVTFNGFIEYAYGVSVSLTGVDQTDPLGTNNSSAVTDANTITYTIATNTLSNADNAWIIEMSNIETGASITCTPNSGQTEFVDISTSASTDRICAGYEGPITPPSRQTVSWTCGGVSCGATNDWVAVGTTYLPVFTGNYRPTISSATDSPDPQNANYNVTFSIDWNDQNVEGVKLYVCKANATSTSGCNGSGSWCTNSNDFETTDPLTCSYTSSFSDMATSPNNYYAFVCDDEGDNTSCSATQSGTFSVKQDSGVIINRGALKLNTEKILIE